MIDSHAHLTAKQYKKDLHTILARAREEGVTATITVGFDLASSEDGARLANVHEDVFAAVGIHPHDARTLDSETITKLEHLCDDPRVIAVGEIGLDFYRNLSPRKSQEWAFRQQITLAKKKGLPVIVHDRDAHRRTIDILRSEHVSDGVLHCFSGDLNLARQAIEMGLHISFAGPITYDGKKAGEIIRRVPPERVLIETDCPYLAPVPFRGKRNEPGYVKFVLERVAHFLDKPLAEVDRLTEQNTRRLFRL